MTSIRNLRIGLLGLVVTALALYFIASQLDLAQFEQALSAARYGYLIPCAALLVLGLVTRAVRWRVLLSGGLPLWRAFHIMNVAYLVNGILPLRAGEVARAYLATRAEPPVPMFTSLSTIIVERLLDLLAVVGLIILALIAAPLPDELRAAALVMGPLALVGFLVLVFLARRRALAHRLLAAFTRRIPFLRRWPLAALFDHFLDGLQPVTRPARLLVVLFWTLVSWACSVVAGWVLMFAFYDQASWAATCLFIAAASLAIAVPAVPGNVGTYESSILLALGAMGYAESPSTAIAFAVVVHGVNLAVYAVLGVLGFIQEGISLGQLSQGAQRMQQPSNVG